MGLVWSEARVWVYCEGLSQVVQLWQCWERGLCLSVTGAVEEGLDRGEIQVHSVKLTLAVSTYSRGSLLSRLHLQEKVRWCFIASFPWQ